VSLPGNIILVFRVPSSKIVTGNYSPKADCDCDCDRDHENTFNCKLSPTHRPKLGTGNSSNPSTSKSTGNVALRADCDSDSDFWLLTSGFCVAGNWRLETGNSLIPLQAEYQIPDASGQRGYLGIGSHLELVHIDDYRPAFRAEDCYPIPKAVKA